MAPSSVSHRGLTSGPGRNSLQGHRTCRRDPGPWRTGTLASRKGRPPLLCWRRSAQRGGDPAQTLAAGTSAQGPSESPAARTDRASPRGRRVLWTLTRPPAGWPRPTASGPGPPRSLVLTLERASFSLDAGALGYGPTVQGLWSSGRSARPRRASCLPPWLLPACLLGKAMTLRPGGEHPAGRRENGARRRGGRLLRWTADCPPTVLGSPRCTLPCGQLTPSLLCPASVLCVCVHVSVYVCVCVHVYLHACVCACICVCVCVYLCVCACTCPCVYLCVYACVRMCARVCVYVHLCPLPTGPHRSLPLWVLASFPALCLGHTPCFALGLLT